VLLVIRVLPEEEFGNFVLIQEVFLIISGFVMGFALQPMLKYAAEERPDKEAIISAALFLNFVFVLACSLLTVAVRHPMGAVLNSASLSYLMLYVPALLAASFARNFALVLLQTRFLMKQIFWTDAAHFIGAVLLIVAFSSYGGIHTAYDLIIINLISLSSSSVLGLFLSRSLLRVRLVPRFSHVKLLWDYGKYSFGNVVCYLFYTKADSFFLSAFSGPVQVAMYNSVKVFLRVFDTVAQVINMFIIPAASRLQSKGEFGSLKALTEKAISFATLGLLPIFVLFLFFAGWLVQLMYGGRYVESVPLLQIFSLLSFVTPLYGVATNTLLGLGHAKTGFYLSLQLLLISFALYAVCIPLWGTLGATVGYVTASALIAWLTARRLQAYVPFTLSEVAGRTKDVKQFIKSRLAQ
jgi:O-antigen/teichoic acid export membrane protein